MSRDLKSLDMYTDSLSPLDLAMRLMTHDLTSGEIYTNLVSPLNLVRPMTLLFLTKLAGETELVYRSRDVRSHKIKFLV